MLKLAPCLVHTNGLSSFIDGPSGNEFGNRVDQIARNRKRRVRVRRHIGLRTVVGEVLEDVAAAGVEEVDEPDVVAGVDQDVGGVEVAVVELVDELPVNATGKVEKNVLRERAAAAGT